jgi:hypothetical protein
MSHIAVITVKVVAETPELDHGDTEARPKPDPSARRINDDEAAAKAPAIIAGQLIAEVDDSRGSSALPMPEAPTRSVTGALTILVIPLCASQISARSKRAG